MKLQKQQVYLATMTFDAQLLHDGCSASDFAEFVRGLGADFIGANCGIGPQVTAFGSQYLAASGSLPVVAKIVEFRLC